MVPIILSIVLTFSLRSNNVSKMPLSIFIKMFIVLTGDVFLF